MAKRFINRNLPYSLNFDGTSDWVTMGDNFNYDYNVAQSYACWFRYLAQNASTAKFIIAKGNASGKGFLFGINSVAVGATMRIEWRNTTTTNTFYCTVPIAPAEKWVHCVVTYDGSVTSAGVKVYFDGVLQTTTQVTNNINASILTTSPFNIGSLNNGTQSWAGQISGTRVFNAELTQAQVNDLYYKNLAPSSQTGYWDFSDGSGTTLTAKAGGINGTINNATWSSTLFPPFKNRTLATGRTIIT